MGKVDKFMFYSSPQKSSERGGWVKYSDYKKLEEKYKKLLTQVKNPDKMGK